MREDEKQALVSDEDLEEMIDSTDRLQGWENVSSALKELQAYRKALRRPVGQIVATPYKICDVEWLVDDVEDGCYFVIRNPEDE